jgi:hypothetical protein
MSQSIKWHVRGQGVHRCNFQWDIIRRQSVVHISASEVVRETVPSVVIGAPEQTWVYNVGAATG